LPDHPPLERGLISASAGISGSGLSINGVSFRYDARGPMVLADVTLSIPAGSFVAIVGRSGTGKSTLLNIILGYLCPTGGTIAFDGDQVTFPSITRVPIYQEDALWPWLRVWENIALTYVLREGRRAASKHKAAINSLLCRVGLDQRLAEKYPKELSVGMRKRVEIARALFARPRILVADEPFSGLDEVTKSSIHDFMIDVWHEGGFSVFFSTHDVTEALCLADRIVVLQGSNPATLLPPIQNPFARNRTVQREAGSGYYTLFDNIVAAMRV